VRRPPPGTGTQPATAIRTDQLTKRYGRRAAVDLLRIQASASFAAELNRQAMRRGATLVELRFEQPSMEATFLHLTREAPQ
jgi:hypothetical protein